MENWKPVVTTKLLCKGNVCIMNICKCEGLDENEENMSLKVKSEIPEMKMPIIRNKLKEICPAAELQEHRNDMLDIFINKEKFRAYFSPNCIERNEENMYIAELEKTDEKEKEQNSLLSINDQLSLLPGNKGNKTKLISMLHELFEDTEAQTIISRMIQIGEANLISEANEQKEKHNKSDEFSSDLPSAEKTLILETNEKDKADQLSTKVMIHNVRKGRSSDWVPLPSLVKKNDSTEGLPLMPLKSSRAEVGTRDDSDEDQADSGMKVIV